MFALALSVGLVILIVLYWMKHRGKAKKPPLHDLAHEFISGNITIAIAGIIIIAASFILAIFYGW